MYWNSSSLHNVIYTSCLESLWWSSVTNHLFLLMNPTSFLFSQTDIHSTSLHSTGPIGNLKREKFTYRFWKIWQWNFTNIRSVYIQCLCRYLSGRAVSPHFSFCYVFLCFLLAHLGINCCCCSKTASPGARNNLTITFCFAVSTSTYLARQQEQRKFLVVGGYVILGTWVFLENECYFIPLFLVFLRDLNIYNIHNNSQGNGIKYNTICINHKKVLIRERKKNVWSDWKMYYETAEIWIFQRLITILLCSGKRLHISIHFN